MSVAALSLRVPARAEQLAGIRSRVADYARAHGLATEAVDDVKTVVSEACANAIKFAYPGALDGPLEVSADVEEGELCVLVRDFGVGLGLPVDPIPAGLHVGLSIIGALTSSFRLTSHRGTGTQVEARFHLNGDA